MRIFSIALFLLVTGMGEFPARATFPGVVTVVQPIGLDGPGLLTVTVTYAGYQVIRPDPGCGIMLTTQPNCIWYDGEAQDLNAAAFVGIRFVRDDTSSTTAWPGLRGDTLNVTVDLSSYKRQTELGQLEDVMITTTLACGLRNARIRWPDVRYVNYTIRGNDAFQYLAGVYPLENIQAPEQASQPDLRQPQPPWLRRGIR